MTASYFLILEQPSLRRPDRTSCGIGLDVQAPPGAVGADSIESNTIELKGVFVVRPEHWVMVLLEQDRARLGEPITARAGFRRTA
jgi:hypothetical protein